MSKWLSAAESALKALNKATQIPYEFECWNVEERGPLPDTYIVYFLVSAPTLSSADNKERSSLQKIQVSLYYRDIQTFKTIPDKILAAFNKVGFRRVNEGRIPFQNNTGHHGWRYDFNYYEKR